MQKSRSLSIERKIILKEWFEKNKSNPYPDRFMKLELSKNSNLNLSQVESWFKYQRKKYNKTQAIL